MNLIKALKKTIKSTTAVLLGGLLVYNFAPLGSYSSLNSRTAYAAPSYAVGFNVDKAQATRGETVNFTLTVTNNGDVNLTNVNIYLQARPQSTTYVNSSSTATKGSNTVSVPDAWYNDPVGTSLGTLTPGQALALKWAVTVNNDAPQGQSLETAADVRTAELQNPQAFSVNFTVAVNQSRSSYCSSKTADKQSANLGDTVTFTIKVCNDGDIDQTNVLIYDRLPRELTYKAGSTNLNARAANIAINDSWIGNPNADGNGINLGTIKSGETFIVTYQATVNSNATDGQTIENTAQTKSDQLPNWKQCAVRLTATVPPVQKAHIVVKKILNPSSDTTKFSFSGSLTGSIGHNETISADVDPGQYTTTESLVGGYDLTSITCDNANSTGDLGNHRATFNVTAGQTVTCTFTNTKQTVVTSPNCSLTKKVRLPNGNEVTSVDSGTHLFTPSEEITYRIFVSDQGSADANNFNITDTLPTYIFWVRGDGSYDSGANKVNFSLGTLKQGESRTLTYTAKVRDQIPSGQITQQNNAQAGFNGGNCSASTSLVISKPGQVLAAAVLPQTGDFPPSVWGTLLLVSSGAVLRLRKIKRYRFWGQ